MTINRRTPGKRIASFVRDWSLPRQLAGEPSKSTAAKSTTSEKLQPRLKLADKVGTSICPYCAVGCAQLIYARNGKVIHVEGDPRSPVNGGRLCPKGAATMGLLNNPERLTTVKYRRPHATDWEEVPLDWAMERIARLTKQTRDETFVEKLADGTVVNHTLGIGVLGGATLDNEENYLMKKVFGGGLGVVAIENQARP
ncbi:formate dehydrogenase major subunit [Faunimonas pinastri]|uniref:Formate dehydrogenase major subunit n=3 Tax=Faunimonas pinastri TaxID=1855383 RepID=A0A1H9A7W6_9HYPH|nr:formate dehydrogenase major subunit [Faunimonas pinastri]